MPALQPGVKFNVAFKQKCLRPSTVDFDILFPYAGGAVEPFVINGSQWQQKLQFSAAQTMWFFAPRQGTTLITEGANWLVESLVTNWKWKIGRETNGWVPFETSGDQINFQITPVDMGASAIGNNLLLKFKLYNELISPIVEPIQS